MNLKHLDLVEDTPDAFRVRDRRDGSSFRVAKKGLGRATHDAVVQHFANGGVVEDVQPLTLPQRLQRAGMNVLGAVAPMVPGVGPGVVGLETAAGAAQALQDPALRQNIMTTAGDIARTVNPLPALTGGAAQAAPKTTAKPTVATAPRSEVEPTPVAPQPTPMPAGPGSASFSLSMPSGTSPGFNQEISGASKQAQEAEMAKAHLAQEQADAQSSLAQDYQAKRQMLSQEWDQRLMANQARADQLSADIASGSIDPSRFWNSRDTGQKVMASIGLILGGIGAGIAGGPNYAQQVIDNAIAKDINAQEKDLGRKENLLQHYMQQGHSIKEAKQLAIADAKDMYASQLEAASSKFGGKMAVEGAKVEGAKLRRQAAIDRQNAYSDVLSNRVKLKDLEQKMAAKTLANMVADGWGQGPIPLTDKEKSDFRDRVAVQNKVVGSIQSLKAIAKKAGTEALPTDAAAAIDVIESDLMLSVAKAAEMGSLDKGLQSIIEKQIGTLRAVRPAQWNNAIARLEQLQRQVDLGVAAKAKAYKLPRLEQPSVQGLVTE